MPAGANFSWRHMAVAAATLAAAEAQCARKRYVVGVLHLVSQAIESSDTERSVPPHEFWDTALSARCKRCGTKTRSGEIEAAYLVVSSLRCTLSRTRAKVETANGGCTVKHGH